MQKLQDSVFSIVKTTNLSPAVFSFLQPTEDSSDKTPLGGILNDTKHGWLALGPKFCVVDLRTGLKVAARTFGTPYSNSRTSVTSVVELPTPLTENSKQLIISLQCEDITSTICIFHVNGSQILRCIQTDSVVLQLAVCDEMPDGPFTCFDGVIMAGTKSGEVFAFDLNRAGLIQALKDISQGYEHLIQNESNPSNLSFLPLEALDQLEEQRDLVLANNDHLAILLNENSVIDGQYIFRNPDGTVRMKAKRDHIRVTVLQYIPQLGSLAVGYNFGAFQIWNLLTLELEFTSQVNVECLPVTHFGFQEPCDDPRAFCYLWVVFSVLDRFEEEGFPLAVMYSLTYQGKRMLSDTKCLYQEFSMATIRFQVELSAMEDAGHLIGGKCVSCHTYSVNSTLGAEGEDSMLNICQLVWECWGESANSSQYGMLLFDLDQWYKDQMPATYRLESSLFLSATWCGSLCGGDGGVLSARLQPDSLAPYAHATRLEEHFYPNSLQYNCICLSTSESLVLSTVGIQRQIIGSLDDVGPAALLNPARLYHACAAAGLAPLYVHAARDRTQEEQRRYLLSVALEARLSRFLKRCARDWATGSHAGAGCTLPFLVDWCWQRAIELKENARELTAPLFSSSALPDRNVVRCLEHCVQQLTQLTGLLDAILTKCCNLVVPEALSSMEEKHKGIGTVSLYFQVVVWFLRAGLLPERGDRAVASAPALPYPRHHLRTAYSNRRMKLRRLEDNSSGDNDPNKSCSLLYIDQLIENEFGGERIHELWQQGDGESNGLYPPPSLYSLLRLYLLPDIAEEHKHSLVLYLLVDYSVVYDEVQYEAVIRRLMQFPTMFGLSNTAIKATQAFWHLDHRDFDFALDQLQCLTGNTLSEWQHKVVLSSLLAQKKTQAALQYLHVRKPAPIQCRDITEASSRVNDHDKLDDWQSCCDLYLARGLVFEALDVVRMCVQNAANAEEKVHILNFFYKGCRNTGQLSKLLQVTLLPLEEDVFIKYLQNCNETQTSDILVMYYLQQARYLEAEQYNNKLKLTKSSRQKEATGSLESLADLMDREGARDTIVEVVCSSLPPITNAVRDFALSVKDIEPHVFAPKPMSVFIQAKSPKNTFTYKSSFIQDTIENASETWINKPKTRRGIKRALNIEDTPFICTPKLNRSKSIFTDFPSDSTPPKRPKMDLNATPRTPKFGSHVKHTPELSQQMAALLDMPLTQSPDLNLYERSGAETPHSILKIRRSEAMERDAASPTDSRYLGDSDDEILETASNHTHYSDSTNKHLRFTIPTASESGSTPSPPTAATAPSYVHRDVMREREASLPKERERDEYTHVTSSTHAMDESNPMESPPKKLTTEEKVQSRKSYKDTVKARRSLSISANSSLSDDPNTSVESIADLPVTLINPRYSRRRSTRPEEQLRAEEPAQEGNNESVEMQAPSTPSSRRGIRSMGESTPLVNRSRSGTPERMDSPITPLRTMKMTRSRSRTPELSPRSSPLQPIAEQPHSEDASEPHKPTLLTVPTRTRSRSRTPDKMSKAAVESPRLEVISESPTKPIVADSPASPASPRRSLRSRSRTPEVEPAPEPIRPASPRSLRSRAKTPEKIMSPKREQSARTKKTLSRIVLEHNTFAKLKSEAEQVQEEVAIECTPMKTMKQVPSLMDVTLSPIVNKSVLQSSNDSVVETPDTDTTKAADKSITDLGLKPLPAFTTLHETYFEKSVLHSYQSSVGEASQSIAEENEPKLEESTTTMHLKSLPAFTSINDTELNRSVLHSYQSSVEESSHSIHETKDKKVTEVSVTKFTEIVETNFEKSVLGSCQSSMAETSQEISKDETGSKLKDASLITNDSDVEMKDSEWKGKIDSQETAAVIQKEKEKIVDIEREINEIEGDMSDDSDDGEDDANSSSDEEIVEGANSEQSGEEESSDDTTSSGTDEEIISIKDTESDDSSSSNRLHIDEGTSNDSEPQGNEKLLHIEATKEGESKENEQEEAKKDPLGQTSMLTDDNSIVESEKSSMELNYSDEVKDNDENKPHDAPMEIEEPAVQVSVTIEPVTPVVTDDVPTKVTKSIDVVDSLAPAEDVQLAVEAKSEQNTPEDKAVAKPESTISTAEAKLEEVPKAKDTTEAKLEKVPKAKDSTEAEHKEVPKSKDNTEADHKEVPKAKDTTETKSNEESPVPARGTKVADAIARLEKEITSQSEDTESESSKTAPKTRKRAKSTSSNKSATETKIEEEIRTPVTRKRSQSNASNKSVTETEQKTPENVETPSRRRAKTPSSTEVRKIITRRASKEMSEKLDESKEILDDSVTATPRRRSTRSRTKIADDNESVASEGSVRSMRSKASEDAGDVKAAPIRKGRKSILSTKPDLSVIPEMIVEEDSKGSDQNISDYSSSRRLTRHQKALLESWQEPSPSARKPRGRRPSAASRASSRASERDDDDASSTHSFEVQPIDRLSLLNKQDFEGSPDFDEYSNTGSPESVASDASKQRRARLGRAGSESKPTPKAAKIGRRTSVDVESEVGSPAGSPARGRRASFHKALEALNTPGKTRRGSTDVRETESPVESVISEETGEATPSRRTRRGSTASAASQAKSDTGKRSKKTSALDESKEKKK